MNIQNFTSANTSINNNSLPTAFSKYRAYGRVLDFGCGKFTNMIKLHVNEQGAKYYPYDKYNMDEGTNDATMFIGKKYGFDTVFCCNVLNVIDSDDVVWEILHTMFNLLNNHSRMYIQIYEGNKTGIGKVTKSDCYQRNEKTRSYEKFFGAFQGSSFTVKYHANVIEVVKHG